MRAGTLRRRLLIQTRSLDQDSKGAQVLAWTDLMTVSAEIEPLSSSMKFNAGAVLSGATHTITVRYQSALSDPLAVAKMRGVYKGRYFMFTAPRDEGEEHRQLEILATEGLVSG